MQHHNKAVTTVGVSLAVGAASLICYYIYKSRQKSIKQTASLFKHTPEGKEGYFELSSDVNIYVVTSEEQCEALLANELNYMVTEETVLGFDLEWTTKTNKTDAENVFSHKTALLQISSQKDCILVRLNKFNDIPNLLRSILENPNILKTGVAIIADARRLFKEYQVVMTGCLDLQPLAYSYHYTGEGSSLLNLAKSVLSIKINKSHHLRCSNWETAELSKHQIHYAALDAWVGREIFVVMAKNHKHPDLSYLEWCFGLIDKKPVNTPSNPNKVKNKPKNEGEQNGSETSVALEVFKAAARKDILYENCRMVSPEGELLCIVDKRKVKWYLKRDLADIVSEDPLTIKLRFKPSGPGHANDPYHLSEKHNRCVVCGNPEKYVRHSVVPHSYRQHLPEDVKSHQSHDIVLMCQRCHHTCSMADVVFSNKIAAYYRVDVDTSVQKFTIDAELSDVKSAAKALLTSKNKLPAERKVVLENVVKKYFNKAEDGEALTEQELEQANNIDPRLPNPLFVAVEKAVTNSLKTPEQIEEFVKMWRKHFLDTMKPQYLPKNRSVDYPVLRHK